MKENMADRIAKRRRELNLTQEELASRIGVSAQAVSNWERRAGYPDVLLIPSLANALGITTDSLFGMDACSDGEILKQLKDEIRRLTESGEQKECLIRYCHRYPNLYGVLEWILWIIYREYREDPSMTSLAKQLGRRILTECTDTGIRLTAAKVLSFLCDEEEAWDYINTFDEHVLLRPNIIGRRLWDRGDRASAHDYFDLEMVLLFQYVVGRNSYCEDAPQKAIRWNEWLLDLLKTLGEGSVPSGWLGHYGVTHMRLAAAHFADGNKEEGYRNLETALRIYKSWYACPVGERLSVGRLSLFDRVSFSRTDGNCVLSVDGKPYNYYGVWETNVSAPLAAETGWTWFDTVRSEERFLGILKQARELEQTYGVVQP